MSVLDTLVALERAGIAERQVDRVRALAQEWARDARDTLESSEDDAARDRAFVLLGQARSIEVALDGNGPTRLMGGDT